MNSKILAVAAIATGAAAMRLETNLESTDVVDDLMLAKGISAKACHGTYAYQCIQEKVDNVLARMEDSVNN